MNSYSDIGSLTALIDDISPIDVHVHQGSWATFSGELGTTDVRADPPGDTGRARDEFLQKFSVREYVLLPNVHHEHSTSSAVSANDDAAEEARASAGIISCAALVGVKSGGFEQVLERAKADGQWGISFHHRFIGTVLDDARMWPICDWARDAQWPIFVHVLAESTLESLWRLRRLAKDFPDLTFVALDGLSSPSAAAECLELAKDFDNILFDTAVMSPVPSMVPRWVRTVGPESLLYGSDLYVSPNSYYFPGTLFEIAASPISDADKRAILRGNAERLLPDAHHG